MLKTLDKVLLIVGCYIFLFVFTTVVIYTVNGWQYDALIPYALGLGGLEGLCTTAITVSKYIKGEEEPKEQEDEEC